MRTCIHCGCTDEDACTAIVDGVVHACSWIKLGDDELTGECSACLSGVCDEVAGDELVTPSRDLILPGDPEFHL